MTDKQLEKIAMQYRGMPMAFAREIKEPVHASTLEECAKICDAYGEQATFMAAEEIRGLGQK